MLALFRRFFRRLKPDGVRALKLSNDELECIVMREFSRAERVGFRIEKDCEVFLALRVAEELRAIYQGGCDICGLPYENHRRPFGGGGSYPHEFAGEKLTLQRAHAGKPQLVETAEESAKTKKENE